MNQTQFKDNVMQNFPFVDDTFFAQIEIYKTLLIQENSKFNLTKLATEEKIYQDYFFESIIPYKSVDFKPIHHLLDIGSGSGIPGVVLKLLYPHIQLTIIETNKKKAQFIQNLCTSLNLTNVHIINKRAEMINKNEYETFDLVTSRAVAILPIILELSIPYAKVNGLIIQPKSVNFQSEMSNIEHIIKNLGGALLRVDHFISPSQHTHNVVIIKKINPTKRIYPRPWSQIIRGKHG
ncbi:MAG: 16S rRNA (guanine(527)-N(7))-methyltransferase RsmG [Mycoplasmataceae bacterium]|jgi:16S rRNA (guanine527-N7)-methyltransferase|nr:16S rRNA (guanine(527)-N(7))-methyltransferase RsmG [Mycoplasmataceae bacterium]